MKSEKWQSLWFESLNEDGEFYSVSSRSLAGSYGRNGIEILRGDVAIDDGKTQAKVSHRCWQLRWDREIHDR